MPCRKRARPRASDDRTESELADRALELTLGVPVRSKTEVSRRRRLKRMLKGSPAVAELAKRLRRCTPERRCELAICDLCTRLNQLRLVIEHLEQHSDEGE